MPSQNHKTHNMKAVASNTIVYFKAGEQLTKAIKDSSNLHLVPRNR